MPLAAMSTPAPQIRQRRAASQVPGGYRTEGAQQELILGNFQDLMWEYRGAESARHAHGIAQGNPARSSAQIMPPWVR